MRINGKDPMNRDLPHTGERWFLSLRASAYTGVAIRFFKQKYKTQKLLDFIRAGALGPVTVLCGTPVFELVCCDSSPNCHI